MCKYWRTVKDLERRNSFPLVPEPKPDFVHLNYTPLALSSFSLWPPDFAFLEDDQTPSEAHPTSYSMGPWALYSKTKWPGLEAEHTPPYSAQVMNEWSYTFTPPPCLQNMYRDFTFIFYFNEQNSNKIHINLFTISTPTCFGPSGHLQGVTDSYFWYSVSVTPWKWPARAETCGCTNCK